MEAKTALLTSKCLVYNCHKTVWRHFQSFAARTNMEVAPETRAVWELVH